MRKLYRYLRGGTWYLVAPWPAFPYINPYWVRKPLPPMNFNGYYIERERILAMEKCF